jgi:hypothetical protein
MSRLLPCVVAKGYRGRLRSTFELPVHLKGYFGFDINCLPRKLDRNHSMIMKTRFFTLPLSLLLSITLAYSQAQPSATVTPRGANNYDIAWAGVAGRTYFIEFSTDLVNYHYLPTMDYGAGQHSYGMHSSTDKGFMRLHYVDASWITNLQQARDADFDGDGISNAFEVETIFSNPMDAESRGGDSENGGVGDGLADAWELFYFGNLTSADPSAIGQADGLTNKEKSDLGLNPLINLSAASAAQPAKFSYDLVGRLTAVTAAISPVTLVPDAEGNLTNAQ